ncbi:heparin lyase I family protein [Bradyrhizobium sp. Ec3.3]|uniref:heparin lyase I family protein n=1 Tax=Bradyrhizobium sp. Ec3.3 TaxID=189753 RepID=UPI001AEBBB08|nr:heparin lyase I family protein [Bradyrhizobium sp. Ec3.3]
MAGNESASYPPVFITAAPSITSFSTKPQTRFPIGGDIYEVDTAGKSYSLTNPDPQTLRFEIRPGDKAYYDDADGEECDRAEIERTTNSGDQEHIAGGTPIHINYQFKVEANGPNGSFINTANWFVTSEMQTTAASGSPAFAIQLDGNHLQIVARYCPVGLDPSNAAGNVTHLTLWTDPNPIHTGQYINIEIRANVSDDSSGYLQVWVNGNNVANYHGPLGFGTPTYWMYGLYRNAGPSETVAAYFRNMTLTTGSGPPGVTSRPPLTQGAMLSPARLDPCRTRSKNSDTL